ncbi:hypothetical protein SCHPADRAFT_942314 [Schizopora paradoxa]|uniref:Uncharacterized protein n=1 Tax=Schizopora paradoxa TaxID=27342 RepID=A0A0H2S288_9AGAM|nr:hypothetical protein SCHPADRAFT_942314 [Schizopora paradoxa]
MSKGENATELHTVDRSFPFLDANLRHPSSSISYEYYSEWSSNITASNLPGPGRNLGRFYSLIGRRIEQALERRIVVIAQRKLSSSKGNISDFVSELFRYASSNIQSVQILAFRRIISYALRTKSASLMHENLRRNWTREAPIEAIVFSWKRVGLDYDVEWSHYYSLVWTCLTDNAVMRAIEQAPTLPNWNEYSDILYTCSNIADAMLVVEFMGSRVYKYRFLKGQLFSLHPASRVIARGRYDRVLKFTALLRIRFELAKPDCHSLCSEDVNFDQLVKWFMKDACSFFGIENSEMREIYTENSEIVKIYEEVFKVFCAILSTVGQELTPFSFKMYHSQTWVDSFFTKFYSGRVRDAISKMLTAIENMHGTVVRERFPPAVYP